MGAAARLIDPLDRRFLCSIFLFSLSLLVLSFRSLIPHSSHRTQPPANTHCTNRNCPSAPLLDDTALDKHARLLHSTSQRHRSATRTTNRRAHDRTTDGHCGCIVVDDNTSHSHRCQCSCSSSLFLVCICTRRCSGRGQLPRRRRSVRFVRHGCRCHCRRVPVAVPRDSATRAPDARRGEACRRA